MIAAHAASKPANQRFLRPVQRAALGSLFTGLVGQSALVVSGVLVARMLGVENRGYLALLVLWPAILSRLGGLGLPLSVPFFVARNPENAPAIAGSLVIPGLVQIFIMLAIHAGILLALLPGRPHAIQVAGVLTLVTVPLSISLEYGLAFLQGQRRFFAFNVLRATQPVLYAVAIAVAFVLGMRDIIFVTVLLACSGMIASCVTLVIAVRGLPSKTPKTVAAPSLEELLKFGLKGLLGSVSPIETFRLDQAVIGLLLSPSALGVYVVALAFTNLPRFVAQSVGMVAYPHIAGQADPRLRRSAVVKFFLFAMALSIPVVLVIALKASWIVPFFFGPRFSGAVDITRILVLGALFLAARRILTDGSRGAGAPSAGTVAEIASWIWLVPAVFLLAPHWGIAGVAWAFTTSSAFSLGILILAIANAGVLVAGQSRTARSRTTRSLTDS